MPCLANAPLAVAMAVGDVRFWTFSSYATRAEVGKTSWVHSKADFRRCGGQDVTDLSGDIEIRFRSH